MSATGKSSTVAALAALGHRAVDLDSPEWSHFVPDDSDYRDPHRDLDWQWREDKVRALLTAGRGTLFVSGTSTYQRRLYPLLDHVVLLTIPEDVARVRLASRTTNSYGKDPAELERELKLREIVEPLLRAGACLEIDSALHSIAVVAVLVSRHTAGPAHAWGS